MARGGDDDDSFLPRTPEERTNDLNNPIAYHSTFLAGLQSPVSLKKQRPSIGPRPAPVPFRGVKRKDPGVIILDDSEDEPPSLPSPPKTIEKKAKTINRLQPKRNKTDQLVEAVTRALQRHTGQSNWDNVVFLHSDEEESDSEARATSPTVATPIPNSPTKPRSIGSSLPLDPGIIRVQSFEQKRPRWIYRFDPALPRPEHAKKQIFGHLPGLYIGKKWHSRIGAAWDGTHHATVAGISGNSELGAWSVVLSGGYEDDFDEGYRFVYTGCGGRDVKVYFRGQHSKHQDWNAKNNALRMNIINEKPVRVIRGYKGDTVWGPKDGFTYSGLYEVVACWMEQGKAGYDVIRFAFKRLPSQDPLLDGDGEVAEEPDYESEDWKGWEGRLTCERAEEVVAIKKEESPDPGKTSVTTCMEERREFILVGDD